MKPPYYCRSDRPLSVYHKTGDDMPATFAVQPEHFPTNCWEVASLMNVAYIAGYAQAQRDIRKSLGINK